MRKTLAILALAVLAGCSPAPSIPTLTDADRAALADTAKTVVQTLMNSADKLDWNAYFLKFSTDADAKFAEAGSLYPSLSEMKKGYDELAPKIESLAQGMDGWTSVVLARDAVAFTTPFHFAFKIKGRPVYNGKGVYSGVMQRRGNEWRIVQAHESWENQDKVIAAMTAAPAPAPKKE